MAALAAVCEVCEALGQTPELQRGPPDAGPTDRLLAALPLNQRLQKPQPEEQSRCVPSEGASASIPLLCGSPGLFRPSPNAGQGSGTPSGVPFRLVTGPTLFISVRTPGTSRI